VIAAQASPEAAFDLAELSWVRIQLVLCLVGRGADEIDAQRIVLEHDGQPPQRTAATGWGRQDGALTVRFNVMQGPGRQPLAPGHWRLAVGGPDESEGVRFGRSPGDVGRHRATFPIGQQLYSVSPAIEVDGTLRLEVRLDPFDRERPSDAPPAVVRFAYRIIRRTRAAVFRVAFRVLRVLARQTGRRILFVSDSRVEHGGNLEVVRARMVERGLDREYELLSLFRASIAIRRSWFDRLQLPWLLASADTVVIEDYTPAIYHFDERDIRVIQLWHAVGSFKTVGYSRVGKPFAPNPFGNVHKNYRYAIVSSETDVPNYAEAFGIPEERVIPTGVPRVDRFLDLCSRPDARELALERFPEAAGRRTILFAPTFRGDTARDATYDFEQIDYAALHALCVEKEAVCIVRMHPFVRSGVVIPEEFRDRILDGWSATNDVNDLLPGIDLLVTDYSSIVYEFSMLDRPMLFFAYDLDEYVAARDFYEPYEDFVPGRIVRTFGTLVDAIRREDCQVEKVPPFVVRHFAHPEGGATDRVIHLILGS
jgi:CDP-ribitol ribitolphosphotransferase